MTPNLLLVAADAEGEIVVCRDGLSFWGGVDATTGCVIDAHHDQHGQSLSGKIVLMPTSRGSCSGSGVLLELALAGAAPAALVFHDEESTLTLGALIAARMFERPVAIIRLTQNDYNALAQSTQAKLENRQIVTERVSIALDGLVGGNFICTAYDQGLLRGDGGPAAKLAMELICAMAQIQGAMSLLDVTCAHIDGCIYAGHASLLFAEVMADMGGQVCVPTTMNAISVDYNNWREQGVETVFGGKASRLADAYIRMGAKGNFTCAPYQAERVPQKSENIGWSESNAVIYANSILGARSEKHPDFFDLFIALTGRAPKCGMYLDEHRVAQMLIEVEPISDADDSFWPMLGWLAGQTAGDKVACIKGLEETRPTLDDLRAFCAAFGTTGSSAIVHIAGITPEGDLPPVKNAVRKKLDLSDFQTAWQAFNSGPRKIDLVALGSPHFSLSETRNFCSLIQERTISSEVEVIITLGRDTMAEAECEGLVDQLEAGGVKLVCDLCWCSISEPVFPISAQCLLTNSGKYAHYAPGLSGRKVRFGSLQDCADAAISGFVSDTLPLWLR